MFAEERQSKIVREVRRVGRAEVPELARTFGVSPHTIRRDLRSLSQRGLLHKTHGGAVVPDGAMLDWKARTRALPVAKEAIGKAAAELIAPGQTVILEAGSTTLAMARHLTVRPLTVITNSLDIAQVFDGLDEVKLIVLGGEWDARARAFRGVAAQHVLRSYRADWTILGACALHARSGAAVFDEEDAVLKRAMAASSLRTMVLADHSKRDQVAAHLVLPTEQLGLVVTDRPWPELSDTGVTVVWKLKADVIADAVPTSEEVGI